MESKVQSSSSLTLNVKMLQYFGTPLFLNEGSSRSRFIKLCYCIILIAIFNVFYIFCEILDFITIRKNFNLLTQNLCLTSAHLGNNIKIINMLIRYTDVEATFNEIRRLPSIFRKTQKHRKVFKKIENENIFILFVYAATVTVTGIVGWYALLTEPASVGGRIFPYRAQLPSFLPLSIRIIYWGFGAWLLGFQIVAIDCLNLNLINQIRCNLKILSINLSDLKSSEKVEMPDACRVLENCVKYHQLILRLRNQIEEIYKYPILLLFFVSLFLYVLTGYQAVVLTSSEGVMLIYFYSSGVFVQLYAYCWFGNQVMEQNKFLTMAGYDTAWYDFGPRFAKILQIFLISVQKPLTFTAGGFFDLSLIRFSGILSRSYTYIAVLRQMYGE